ncbi:MAG: type I-E CRISPR-associated protein Cas6/Cse3/CasE [Acidobacteriota bacterium]|nr:type I-E CRISPR-associated protein Cas6/Cse3/CasE [Acidobacteriota bacterium]
MKIYLTKIILNPQSRRVWDDLGNLQNMHRTVSRAFPAIEADAAAPHHERRTPRSEYNLLHRLDFDARSGKAVLLVQSNIAPDWSFLNEDYAVRVECKTVHEQYSNVENGMRLLFRLQANPTKRVGKSDTKADKRFHESKIRRRVELIGDEHETVEEKQIKWLARKGENAGFCLTNVRIKDNVENAVAAAQGKIKFRKNRSDDRKITFGSVVFEGVLEVTDAGKFREALQTGIGTGKAYGFGLLSIAPNKEN